MRKNKEKNMCCIFEVGVCGTQLNIGGRDPGTLHFTDSREIGKDSAIQKKNCLD